MLKSKLLIASTALVAVTAGGIVGAQAAPIRFLPFSFPSLATRLNPFSLTVTPVRAAPVFAARAALPMAFISMPRALIARATPVVSPLQPPSRSPLQPARPPIVPFRPLPPAPTPMPAPPRAAPIF